MEGNAGRSALVAGGSGLVGSRLLLRLLQAPEYARVHALSRRALPLDHPRLANRVVRFDAPLELQLKGLQCQDAFCCLGTTLREAGSQAAFRAVDYDLLLRFARIAAGAGAQRLVLLSAVGANPMSKNFYLRVKGETERAIETLRFPSLDILQPSVLLGTRREFRPLEVVAQAGMWVLGPLLLGNWARLRAIDATMVAAAMYGAACSGRRGLYRYTYDGMRALSHRLDPPRL